MTLRKPHLIPVAMFFSTFAWSFVSVSLPFHIQTMGTADAALGPACVPLFASRALAGRAL